MEQNYTYPAILDYSEQDFVHIIFPDFAGAMTSVLENEDYIIAAQEFLALTLLDFEDENISIPQRSSIDEITLQENQQIIYVNIWMPFHRSKVKEVYVKKTLTIPAWLDILAKNNKINFSATLVKGLKIELGMQDNTI